MFIKTLNVTRLLAKLISLICLLSLTTTTLFAANKTDREAVALTNIKKQRVATLNSDLEASKLTMDVGIIIPSNFDSSFKRVTVDKLLDGIASAKKIFSAVDVQINLLWVRTGQFNKADLSIVADKPPLIPESQYVTMYEHMRRHPSALSEQAEQLFKSIIEPHPDNHRTIYIVALQEVFLSFYEKDEKTKGYQLITYPTSGLSLPGYVYGSNMPKNLRGVITISGLEGEDSFKTIAHEIGHKVINVSHEYKESVPGFEVFGDGGLMIYGMGTDIPAGKEGRWNRERLYLSPYLYRMEAKQKIWNPGYEEGGHYFDPIYGDKVIYDTVTK